MNLNHLGSRTAFTGFYRACFSDRGRIPDSSDALHMAAKTGANTLAARLMSQVGVGSSEQCFVGDFMRSLSTAGAVIGVKLDSGTAVRGVIWSGSAVAVLARIFSTFPTKCDANKDPRSLLLSSLYGNILEHTNTSFKFCFLIAQNCLEHVRPLPLIYRRGTLIYSRHIK